MAKGCGFQRGFSREPLRIHRAAPAASQSSRALEDLWGISLALGATGRTELGLDLGGFTLHDLEIMGT